VPATSPTICGHTISTLCNSGIGAPGTEPRSIIISPSLASMDCCAERIEGSSTIATISLYKTTGDRRANACWVSSIESGSFGEGGALAIVGENSGQRKVTNSQTPSATTAAVAGERNTIEHNSASATQKPP